MNVEIGAEAALFPEKEYISGIFIAVLRSRQSNPGMAGANYLVCISKQRITVSIPLLDTHQFVALWDSLLHSFDKSVTQKNTQSMLIEFCM
jgi:hypothetical protein